MFTWFRKKKIEDIYYEAKRLMITGEIDDSILQYNLILKKDPGHGQSYIDRGTIFALKGDYENAKKDFNASIGLGYLVATAMVNIANICFDCGDKESSITYYKKALKLEPDNAFAHFNYSRILIITGKVEEAKILLNQALSLTDDEVLLSGIKGRIEDLQAENNNS